MKKSSRQKTLVKAKNSTYLGEKIIEFFSEVFKFLAADIFGCQFDTVLVYICRYTYVYIFNINEF